SGCPPLIGRAPMMAQPLMMPAMPFESYPVPARPPQPARPGPTPAPQPLARPTVRAQAPEEAIPDVRPAPAASRPAPLTMPSPEQLGVSCAPVADRSPFDWGAVHRRLDQLGMTCFHAEKLAQGGYRLTCLLPTKLPTRSHRIEAEAATEAEAARLVLAKAEEWVRGR